MEYIRFTIEKYKGISNTIILSLNKKIIPIIGTNESGKTTILQAISAFDYRNDNIYDHAKNYNNLQNDDKTACIKATIKIDKKFKIRELATKYKDQTGYDDFITAELPDTITITRTFNGSKTYHSESFKNFPKEINNDLCQDIINLLPKLIYLGAFNQGFNDKITLNHNRNHNLDNNEDYSLISLLCDKAYDSAQKEKKRNINDLLNSDDNDLRNIKEKLQTYLSRLVNDNWAKVKNFEQLQPNNQGIPKVGIEIIKKDNDSVTIKFFIDEKQPNTEDTKSFTLSQRSKGFNWFFNFLIKTRLNISKNSNKLIYLLDEPGSYLHPQAQKELGNIFLDEIKDKHTSCILFTTHYPYILNEKYYHNCHVAYKEDSNIFCCHYAQAKNARIDSLDPLRHHMGIYDHTNNIIALNDKQTRILIVEGITDKALFSKVVDDDIFVIAATGAPNIKNLLAFLCAKFYNKTVIALYDYDNIAIEKKAGGNYLRNCLSEEFKNFTIIYDNQGETLESFIDASELGLDSTTKSVKDALVKKLLLPDYDLKNNMPRSFEKLNAFYKKNILTKFEELEKNETS